MAEIRIFFDKGKTFTLTNVRGLIGLAGLYFIYNTDIQIRYPFGHSRLIYIGMSERKTNSIGKRLQGHLEGVSGNEGIVSYQKVNELMFTYISFEMLKRIWNMGVEPLESFFISSFVRKYGVYPICNNKSGYDFMLNAPPINFEIDWEFFEG